MAPWRSYVYIDNSNVFIEGTHVCAVANRLAPNITAAQERRINDKSFKLDFAKLYELPSR